MPCGKVALRLNLDETSLRLGSGAGGKGTVISPGVRRAVPAKKACMTHVAILCDDPALQPILPQVLIGNRATLLIREMAWLEAACPRNVHLIRKASAWNSASTCARIIRVLGDVLRPHAERYQPLLLFDAAKLHLHPLVLRACRAAGIRPLVVPPCLTWVLQPCDTHAFRGYKERVRLECQRARASSPAGDLAIATFLQCVYRSIQQELGGRDWAAAFEHNGFGRRQRGLSSRVRRAGAFADIVEVPPGEPTLEEIAACFPRRTRARLAAWRGSTPERQGAPVGAVGGSARGGGRRLPPSFTAATRERGDTASSALAYPGASGRGPRTRSEYRAAAALARTVAAELDAAAGSRAAAGAAAPVQAALGYTRPRGVGRAARDPPVGEP